MRHAARWGKWAVEYVVAVCLTWIALGGPSQWLQAMAIVTLFLWAGCLAVRVLARLLEAFAGHSGEGGDGGGPEDYSPVIIHTEDHPINTPKPGYRKWWRN